MDIFKEASRKKIRFESARGLLTVEDLWDLQLISKGVCLDSIAIDLDQKLKARNTNSFVTKKDWLKDDTQLMFDLVKHVIDTKLKERALAEEASLKKEKREKLDELISQKENEHLASKSLEELKAQRAELQ